MSPISNSVLHQPPLLRQLLAHGLARPAAGDEAPAGKGQGLGGKHRPSLAQRLAPWLAWADAIALAGALDAAPPTPASPVRAAAAGRDAEAALEAARHALTQAIDRDEPEGVDAVEWPADASPGRRYQAHQQAMASRIGPLRARVRSALAAQSTSLARVAMLDQRIEQALGARERQLLAAVPAWLDHKLQRDPTRALAVMQPLLHAELAHRLQPVVGMVAALADGERAA